jgi:GNAT superfamily N-acetyltransferase
VVRPVTTPAGLNRFIGFPYDLHRGDPQWVAPLRMDIRTLLSRTKNPFFQHGAAEYFLAERDGRVVGRIAAIRNDAHGAFHPEETHVGFFGFFECVDDQAVADALFARAADWLRAQGLTVMRGPASFSTNDECGLLVDGFDTPPAIMNPHNPRYYVALLERAGFVKAMDLLCYEGYDRSGPPERLVEGARRMAERSGVSLRTLDMKRFWDEVEKVKQVYNAAWEKNWGFIPMTDAELNLLAKQLKPVVVPELVVFAEKAGELIGMAIAIPDFNVALKHNPSGRLLPFGLLKILWHKRKIRRIRVLTLGVLKPYRRSGADVLMYEHIWREGRRLGFNWGEASWLLETNHAIRNPMERLGFTAYKTLRLYDKPL